MRYEYDITKLWTKTNSILGKRLSTVAPLRAINEAMQFPFFFLLLVIVFVAAANIARTRSNSNVFRAMVGSMWCSYRTVTSCGTANSTPWHNKNEWTGLVR